MKKKIKVFIFSEIFYALIFNYVSLPLFQFFKNLSEGAAFATIKLDPMGIALILQTNIRDAFFIKYLIITNLLYALLPLYLIFAEHKGQILKTGTMSITDKISIPVSAGNGEYGNQHFLTLPELKRVKEISCYRYYGIEDTKRRPVKGGFVLGIRAIGKLPDQTGVDEILYVGEDRHFLVVGATRCGKTRRINIVSICLTILAGENMVITDPKGELFAYTSPFAKKNGYQVVVIDFRDPNKGNHYNFMQEIVDDLAEGNEADAIDKTWDLVNVLVGELKGEPIWHNGECATIASVILAIAKDAPAEYKNLTNVYFFLANMAKPDSFGEMPFSRYLQALPETHPARAVFAMAEIAHVKTRSSFFSSALGTLKFFTNPKIAEMTSRTDIRFADMTDKKTIIYIILPDEKTTLYGLGSMFIQQHYTYLVKETNKNGGRCPIDWWYFADEFGNMPYIPSIPQYLSVGAGRGLRFVLFIQEFQQLQKKYKEDYKTIKNNCDGWIYLKCAEPDTLKEFSNRLGHYTIQVNSTNFNDKGKDSAGSHGASLTGRELLKPEEVGLIEDPYSLVSLSGKMPLMLISPDLSFYHFNDELGLGDQNHNRMVYKSMQDGREERNVGDMKLWGIWNDYLIMDEYEDEYESESKDEKLSFLD